MKKVAIAQELQMVYSRAQRTARVHLHHPEADTDYGRTSRCSSKPPPPLARSAQAPSSAMTPNVWRSLAESGSSSAHFSSVNQTQDYRTKPGWKSKRPNEDSDRRLSNWNKAAAASAAQAAPVAKVSAEVEAKARALIEQASAQALAASPPPPKAMARPMPPPPADSDPPPAARIRLNWLSSRRDALGTLRRPTPP